MLLLLCLGAIGLAACQARPPAAAAVSASPAGPTPAAATHTPVRPPVMVTVVPTNPPAVATTGGAAEMPSFAPADPTRLSATVASATRAGATATAMSPTAPPAATATPQPTYTPPALPFTSDEDHFWLRRPIPAGGTVWTDKAYPYGSTRGGSLRPHHGVEFYVPAGTEVLAAASGTVVVAGSDSDAAYGPQVGFYGNLVVIQHDAAFNGQAVYTLYGHLAEPLVTVGQTVAAQELIARSGATGVAEGAHLHFEVRLGANQYDRTRNPLLWLYPFPDHGAVAGRLVDAAGRPLPELPLVLRRIDAPARYHGTTSYAANGVNGDDRWQENFAFDDVAAGYYEVEVQAGDAKVKQELWVFPYRTTVIEIVLQP